MHDGGGAVAPVEQRSVVVSIHGSDSLVLVQHDQQTFPNGMW